MRPNSVPLTNSLLRPARQTAQERCFRNGYLRNGCLTDCRRFVMTSVLLIIMLGCASTQSKKDQEPDPLHALALMRQGSVLFQQGRYDDALKLFEEAQQETPTNGTIYNMIGLCHLRTNNLQGALDAFTSALVVIPVFTDARNNRGATYLALRQYQLAKVDFVAVLADSTYPHHWEVYFNLGLANQGRGQLGAAVQNFTRAINAPRPVYAAYLRLADIKQQQGSIDQAIDLLEEAELKFPDRLEASLALGKMLTTLGRTAEAKAHLERVVNSYPGSEIAKEAEILLEGN
jgi:tetratricopeptide (TPR) repeat protein